MVQRMAADAGVPVEKLLNDRGTLSAREPERYVCGQVGLPTVRDILRELEKPGRDPRPEFHTASFREGVETLNDLEPGMILEGTVTNVTHSGTFVDIGVHQDGLVHISALADRFVKDPREVVKTGDIVRVKVMEVDSDRKRIGLSMRLGDASGPAPRAPRTKGETPRGQDRPGNSGTGPAPAEGTMGALLKQALEKR